MMILGAVEHPFGGQIPRGMSDDLSPPLVAVGEPLCVQEIDDLFNPPDAATFHMPDWVRWVIVLIKVDDQIATTYADPVSAFNTTVIARDPLPHELN